MHLFELSRRLVIDCKVGIFFFLSRRRPLRVDLGPWGRKCVIILGFMTNANAAKTLKCQTVISAKADEVVMLKDFTDTVTALTGG